jgi:hypothetical protein
MAVRSLQVQGNRKPNLMVLVSAFVGFGFLVTSLAQAEGGTGSEWRATTAAAETRGVLLQNLSLETPARYRALKAAGSVFGSGLNVARPFGDRGPAVTFSTSVPKETRDSLRAGGGSGTTGWKINQANAYLFLQKRW